MYPLIALLFSLILALFKPSTLITNTQQLESFLTHSLNVPLFAHNAENTRIFLPILQDLYQSNTPITRDTVLSKFNLIGLQDTNTSKRVDVLCDFINSLRTNLLLQKPSHIKNDFPVLIIGSGPSGLISSIEIYLQGITNIQIFEKRDDYSRNIWFDVADLPWSVALDNLKKWGWKFQEGIEQVSHSIGSNEVISMHAVTIEKFLSKVALILNITIHYNMEFLTICNNTPQPYAIFRNKNSNYNNQNFDFPTLCENNGQNFSQVCFDFVVGADGVNSRVRNSLSKLLYPESNEFFPITESFTLAKSGGVQKTVTGMKQTALIVNYKKNATTNNCPDLKKDKNGYVLDPWYPSFFDLGISSVWKRFYFNHCQMQILFTHDVGARIVDNYEKFKSSNHFKIEDTQAWKIIFSVSSLLLSHPPPSLHSLTNLIETKNNNQNNCEEYDILLFHILIRRAKQTAFLLTSENADCEKENSVAKIWCGENKVKKSIGVIVGDAVLTAHFRLGVGVNNAFNAIVEVGSLVKNLVNNEDVNKSVEKFNSLSFSRESALVSFQVSAMYYESYCDFAVTYNMSQNLRDLPLKIFEKNLMDKSFNEVQHVVTAKYLENHCTQ